MTTRFGYVSSYPPTRCGLATFTAALYRELETAGGGPGRVIQAVDRPAPAASEEVVGSLVAGEAGGGLRAAALLNQGDVAIIQHEYGIYGGADGDEILPLLAALTVPSIVVLHTVLSEPTPGQRAVLEMVAGLAGAVVTMTMTARDRLAGGYAVDMAKVSVIPHGAPITSLPSAPVSPGAANRPTILTWGLIGPGKGIEWGVEAMALLQDLSPAPRYVVAGQTHPKVLAHAGESYRHGLQARAHELGLDESVIFDSRYLTSDELNDLVAQADIVLLPYDSTEQVTSGVLSEAVAASKPVVATRFPHAQELLSTGAGLLVPHRDPAALAVALRTLLTHRDIAEGMSRAAVVAAPRTLWPAVAQRYLNLAERLIKDRVNV
ncbi:glycosyltransferase [Kineosporia rhizophila]|uniref:glycosyltransferase n=1 Tax=Kineosporia TaxID=49184 RepID=UPI001E3FCDCA|nr:MULTISPECIES: glycosyltransferase [Kineosporia]MCE0537701.1 glycosyltransferase [Kineosporia rhizophila]GLY14896.1 glycosyl transferase family 1 [Kineosporia sp. NBRC 101677]